MANSRSAMKRIRTNMKRREYNRANKSRVRTLIRRFEEALALGQTDEAKERYNAAASALDRAASKGVIHKNQAARRKSRMAAKLARSS